MNSELSPNLDPRKGGRFKVPTILQMEATECGAACLGMGSKLVAKDLVASGDWAGITQNVKDCLALIKEARANL